MLSTIGYEGIAYDSGVAELMDDVSNQFIEKLMKQAVYLASLRNSNLVDLRDMQVALDKYWGIVVPGHSSYETALQSATAERMRLLGEGAERARVAARNGTKLYDNPAAHMAVFHATTLHAHRAEVVDRAQPSLREAALDNPSAAAAGGASGARARSAKQASGAPVLSLQTGPAPGAAAASHPSATAAAAAGSSAAAAAGASPASGKKMTLQVKRRREGAQ
jgi:hypothetical protein